MTIPAASDLASLRERCVESVPEVKERYATLEDLGFHQAQFQTLEEVWRSESGQELVARLQVPDASDRYHVHPALLDGVFQLVEPLSQQPQGAVAGQ